MNPFYASSRETPRPAFPSRGSGSAPSRPGAATGSSSSLLALTVAPRHPLVRAGETALALPGRAVRGTGRLLWRARRVIVGTALVGAIGGGVYAANDFAYNSPYFDVAEVIAVGGSEPLRREAVALAGLADPIALNLTSLDAGALASLVEAHPRVESARVSKRYPNTVVIELEERRAAAILVGSPAFAVDFRGVAIAQVDPADLLRAAHLPLVTGVESERVDLGKRIDDPALREALRLRGALAIMGGALEREAAELHLDAELGVVLVLRGGLRAAFGAAPRADQLAALEALVAGESEWNLGWRTVDLRFESMAALGAPANAGAKEASKDGRR